MLSLWIDQDKTAENARPPRRHPSLQTNPQNANVNQASRSGGRSPDLLSR